MERIEWNMTYSVKISSIDDQHRDLFSLVNRFGDSFSKGKAREVLSGILEELIEYTKYHFAHEEEILAKFGYPEQENHEVEHEKLTQRVLDFKEKFDRGEGEDPEKVMSFLSDWLKTHILVSDRRYAKFLKGKGAR